jgi:hypothetical protein
VNASSIVRRSREHVSNRRDRAGPVAQQPGYSTARVTRTLVDVLERPSGDGDVRRARQNDKVAVEALLQENRAREM